VLDPLRLLVSLCDVNERLVGMVADAQSPDWRPCGVTPQVALLVEGAAAALAVHGVWLQNGASAHHSPPKKQGVLF